MSTDTWAAEVPPAKAGKPLRALPPGSRALSPDRPRPVVVSPNQRDPLSPKQAVHVKKCYMQLSFGSTEGLLLGPLLSPSREEWPRHPDPRVWGGRAHGQRADAASVHLS